ncbi:helicase DnaB [Paenibacillus sp. J5C_2022]|uniref:helicase DnaB n=1 Tax=Paenibacillus sp. J5C2022 TaxID=2977129 RepID=UPI0021D233F5|nr:helicase DnaB [Paenibacillus sp. J5C2022]MCU6709837.1 helicase DnaB [Paenibacillus sp. J5C2022]
MRIGSMLEFTEHHRYYIFRDFSLSSLDHKMLTLIYQPIVGGLAVSLYHLLYQGIEEGKSGYSRLEPQRKLFLGLGMALDEKSRRMLIEQASKLEAVGLLQSSRLAVPEHAEVIYEYELMCPLSPGEFFQTVHLTMLLRDKVGKYAVISLRESFGSSEPDELAHAQLEKENISVPFYELFQLNMQSFDTELEQALTEVAPARQAAPRAELASARIPYGEIILRFPRNSANRSSVERLRHRPDSLAQVNYVAYKYNLNVTGLCRLLDEDDIFDSNGELNVDELQLKANGLYRHQLKRDEGREKVLARAEAMAGEADDEERDEPEYEVSEQYFLPVPSPLQGRCDIQQYNMLMRNEPHTRFLRRFFPGAVPDWIVNVFERIDLHYKLAGPVINVLIHYVIGSQEAGRITRTYLDAVASNMLMKGLDTFEKAVVYVREQAQMEQDKGLRQEAARSAGAASGKRAYGGRSGGNGRSASRKPSIPIVQEGTRDSGVTEAELEELRRLAHKLDGKQ